MAAEMWPPSLCLLFLALVYTAESNQFNELVGGSVTFHADHGNTASEITWKKGEDKLADVERNIAPYFYILHDRASADFFSGTLIIRNLIVSDSAMYTAEVLIQGQYDKRHFKLTVFDAVPQPNGTCTRNKENVTLHCTFPPSPSTIVTLQNSSNITVCNTATCTITMATEGDVTCKVRNPASEKMFKFHCPPPPDADIPKRSHTLIAYALAAVFALVAVVTVGFVVWIKVFYSKKKDRGKKNENPEDNQQTQPLILDSNHDRGKKNENPEDNQQTQPLILDSYHELVVTTHLHGKVILPCKFSFITGPESLYVTWVKKDALNDKGPIAHVYQEGEDKSESQDETYKGRTELNGDLSRGELNLMLSDVTYSDEGIYYCQATNLKDRGDIAVRLCIEIAKEQESSKLVKQKESEITAL